MSRVGSFVPGKSEKVLRVVGTARAAVR